MKVFGELNPAQRILMGPGPSNVHPRVLKAMSTPLIGHLDPEFLTIMNEVMELLRGLFQTRNSFTIPVSGTGSSGMEALFSNVIEEGDTVIVGINGLFGQRMSDIVERCRGKLIRVEAPWGEVIKPEQVEQTLRQNKAKLVAVVHAETSTGAWQSLEEIGKIAHKHGALFLVDTVTSLGGCPVKVDEWGIDLVYSGTQKCLSCPPGLAPVSFNERAMEVIRKRSSKVQSWYLDMTMIEKYWGSERFYHHTAPISMIYALRESLRLISEEGLEERFHRHKLNHQALAAGLKAIKIGYLPKEDERLWMLNAVCVPHGIDELKVRKRLLLEHNIEIGGGLGELKGKIWRIGLMGYTCSRQNVLTFLSALEEVLSIEGYKISPGASLTAASMVYGVSL